MFENDNRFHDNRYEGNWRFATGWGETIRVLRVAGRPLRPGRDSTIDGDAPGPVRLDLDRDTSSLEGSIGAWAPWYSAAIERTSEAAHRGSHSLRVDVTAPYGWGVELGNWPGFPAAHGTKVDRLLGQGRPPGPRCAPR